MATPSRLFAGFQNPVSRSAEKVRDGRAADPEATDTTPVNAGEAKGAAAMAVRPAAASTATISALPTTLAPIAVCAAAVLAAVNTASPTAVAPSVVRAAAAVAAVNRLAPVAVAPRLVRAVAAFDTAMPAVAVPSAVMTCRM